MLSINVTRREGEGPGTQSHMSGLACRQREQRKLNRVWASLSQQLHVCERSCLSEFKCKHYRRKSQFLSSVIITIITLF